MDWERTDIDWAYGDFSHFAYEKDEFELQQATAVTKLEGDKNAQVEILKTRGDWKLWFDKTVFDQRSGFCVIIYSKAKQLFSGSGFAPLTSLPVTRNIFSETVQKFNIQPCIKRTIMREVIYFSAQSIQDSELNHTRIGTTARTASSSDEIAMSSTFHVERGLSLAVVFGCAEEQRQQLLRKLQRVRPEHLHPLIVPGIFFELERARLEECVDQLLDNFALNSSENRPLDLDMGKREMADYLKNCYRSRELGNKISALERQLIKMMKETTRLEKTFEDVFRKKSKSCLVPGRLEQLMYAGHRIKSRLEEMCDTLDDKINSCNVTIENMSLTMQTLWNHLAREDNRLNIHFSRVSTDLANTNKRVSQAMQGDSSQMKYIALLTMVFLPISTMASIFSTGLFSWEAGPGEAVVSRYFWVFVVISLGLTTLVVGAWGIATRYVIVKRKNRVGEVTDVEKEDKSFHPGPEWALDILRPSPGIWEQRK